MRRLWQGDCRNMYIQHVNQDVEDDLLACGHSSRLAANAIGKMWLSVAVCVEQGNELPHNLFSEVDHEQQPHHRLPEIVPACSQVWKLYASRPEFWVRGDASSALSRRSSSSASKLQR